MNLPDEIAQSVAPVFEVLRLEEAMPCLTGTSPKHTELVQKVVSDPVLAERPALVSALWLYVDDLDRSHKVSQDLPDVTGSYWHFIMHRREGDFPNARYWAHRAGAHPLLKTHPEFSPLRFVDEVQAAHGTNPDVLLKRQRDEWAALFAWCAARR